MRTRTNGCPMAANGLNAGASVRQAVPCKGHGQVEKPGSQDWDCIPSYDLWLDRSFSVHCSFILREVNVRTDHDIVPI